MQHSRAYPYGNPQSSRIGTDGQTLLKIVIASTGLDINAEHNLRRFVFCPIFALLTRGSKKIDKFLFINISRAIKCISPEQKNEHPIFYGLESRQNVEFCAKIIVA